MSLREGYGHEFACFGVAPDLEPNVLAFRHRFSVLHLRCRCRWGLRAPCE
jgi:hypothetical protein